MEVLPCSGIQCVGETDSPHDSSGTAFSYHGEANCLENGEQVKLVDGRLDDLSLSTEVPQIERQHDVQNTVGELSTNSDCQGNGASCGDCQVENHRISCDFHDIEVEDINEQHCCVEPCFTSDNSHPIVDTIESESPNSNREVELSLSEPTWLEGDESVALWVKWRGKWQAGIRCARADWPLSTLRAKPTHDRKKYFVIFFPHTRNHSWADMLLVRSINEFPLPIAYKTHEAGLKMVKDLTVARRFIMQKLAVGMLNIIDQFHVDALIETARNVVVWKEFAMEASHCNNYSDLGRMLLKLQNMILPCYINAEWLQHSFHPWIERCQNANSAESFELLKEELFDSILWNKVNSLRDAPMQPTLGSEWKIWKHEVMKWFSMSHPLSSSKDIHQQSSDGSFQPSFQVCRKRPKLEVRRAEPHASQVETKGSDHAITLETDPGFSSNQEIVNTLAIEISKQEDFREVAIPTESPSVVANKWNEIVVDAGDSEFIHRNDAELTPINEVVATTSLEPGSKNRQCTAFIEAKGRQCVRWANDGDVYCCVHLSSRFLGSSAKAEKPVSVDAPMCEGTTVLGTRCKHRALPGLSFCKKHRPHTEIKQTTKLPQNLLKRKYEETNMISESMGCKDMVLVGDVESPLQVDPIASMDSDAFHRRFSLTEKPEQSGNDYHGMEVLNCIGSSLYDNNNPCAETPKRHFLYCEKHLPSWLKRARNGKSRIISKEVFTDLLRECDSMEQKVHLHKACELFYRLFKSILSLRNPVPKDVQFQWALSEASKDTSVGEFFAKLVYSEKERIKMIWEFNDDKDVGVPLLMEEPSALPSAINDSFDNENAIKCKICSKEFLDDQALGSHWMDSHKKEAQWLFRGHACAICLDSFTNKKVLETHVQERHHVQFVEQCMLLQCIPCGSHFGNTEQLWLHVLSVHPIDLRPSKSPQQQTLSTAEDFSIKFEQGNSVSLQNNCENSGGSRKFTCRFCGLKFDLLPDLGRHHQAAHMGPNLVSTRPTKKGVRYYAYRLKSGRLSRPRLKKGLAAASYRIRSRANASLKRRIQESKSLSTAGISLPQTEATNIGSLAEFQCSEVAKILFSEIQNAKSRPNNLDILSIARSACCKFSLKASLEEKYGVLPESLYLKAAKLCSEHNIQVNWHQEGFVCPRDCKPLNDQPLLSHLTSFPSGSTRKSGNLLDPIDDEWEVDECHYIIDSYHLRPGSIQKAIVLCSDISFGQELIPVVCVADEDLLNSPNIHAGGSDRQDTEFSMPWESFTYVTKPILDQSLSLDTESLQLGCACSFSSCCPETCDHVYLFDIDYEDAKDINGKPMRGRFPYDENGRIILEEGYLVYECNHMCSCNRTCPNRVLQNGVRVKLEVFKTEKKGWAVRAGETILRGTFICECIGEVLDEQEANNRRNRYGKAGCSHIYTIDAHINDMSRITEEQAQYVIDSTRYGNISRFINHSCLPNLVSHQVLVESMDCQRAHIGLYASEDIALGEELTYDYRYELLPGEGYPCHCGSPNCRGRLY
ncbi:Histone-lysine N-methyltransferase SUVR5 [Quillaja saponaria]|uniref:Histone-lysine N-methyltransferase SUVR5 n=1 Tax=Quillaja saponaria TaxID=32244 RepID=A0AAD7KRB3_QUISA|nr:Histone-lysine N-methyltransferase SUVR5 [Quillaja saponaria]KAJ7944360.1 Histone-lysine N-methyltransferase SUVR5 [Quillaja saponaria]